MTGWDAQGPLNSADKQLPPTFPVFCLQATNASCELNGFAGAACDRFLVWALGADEISAEQVCLAL